MKTSLNVLCLFVLLGCFGCAEVSLENLKGFFWATYDRDDDGIATVQEFVDYFRFMEPEHNIT
jgi:hypothetical protein